MEAFQPITEMITDEVGGQKEPVRRIVVVKEEDEGGVGDVNVFSLISRVTY